ncbi:MAG: hypothetical protein ACLPKH_18700, partial [Rhodomicrobium sp.]
SVLDDVQIFDEPAGHRLFAREQCLNLPEGDRIELPAPGEFSGSTFSRLTFCARTVRHKLILAADFLYPYFALWHIKSMQEAAKYPALGCLVHLNIA